MPVVTLLHTNDLHGQFDQMTRLASLVAGERALAAAENRPLLLLDAGDSSDYYAWESHVTQGRANFAMLEAMGYQAAALGNAESSLWDSAALAKLVSSVHFPVLAANLFADESDQLATPPLKPSAVFALDEVRVGVIGLTVNQASAFKRLHYRCEPPLAVAERVAAELRAGGARLIIALTHLGIEADRELARDTSALDVIVGGHSHTVLREAEQIGRTLIVQAGSLGQYLGRLDLSLDDSGRLAAHHYRLIPCEPTTPPDPTLSGMLELIRFEAGSLRKKTRNQK